jgi:ABC-2 type transport system ATP-binding protein
LHSLKNISKYFYDDSWSSLLIGKKNKSIALENLSFDIYQNDCIAILGKNGSGKSTLLRLIGNILTPDKGTITINNKEIDTSYISGNERSFFWRLTVFENLEFFSKIYGRSDKKIKKDVENILNKLGLSQFINTKFMSLSSGFKKRVSIARALIKNPDIFLFDEITTSLDKTSKNQIISTINDLRTRRKNKVIMWATHDVDEALNISNKIILLEGGTISSIINHDDKEFNEEYISKFL